MTEAIHILQSAVTAAGDILLCIGAVAFFWLLAMGDEL
jgi:hypothetical protein